MTDDRSQQRHGPGGVGASSGGEQLARERTVPGTGSAREGYHSQHGTGAGTPLEGVEMPQAEEQEIRAADDVDQPQAGPVRHRTR